ncbi:uncharacterized protein LOC132723834 [Ruditapes philippinarum]|uniref:uncharacterized protein LOC132723834 n=1 Tax=Ruditapes philippinarum TaxID=129788 RepID=UPI00295BEC34|nr:uncharacterized protein LOC132723834 [Ruditapes philippinarum]
MANSKFSSFVFTVIDLAGINHETKRKRIECTKQMEEALKNTSKRNMDQSFETILTGSKSEGVLPMWCGSDLDRMQVFNNTICVDEANLGTKCNFDILVAEYENTPPGYIRVRHKYRSNDITKESMLLQKSYWYGSTGGAPFISSKLITENYLNFAELYQPPDAAGITIKNSSVRNNGPSVTNQTTVHAYSCEYTQEFDNVLAIYFYNSSILNDWSTRARYNDWPSEELIHEVSTTEGYIIPVGEKKSATEHLEWRISHVTAEKKLLMAFNSTQDKLYIILKLFSKLVFSSVSKSFSSYMVKNVVLWMAEIYPSHYFTPDLFIAQLLQSFNFIKQCLINNHLPSYMLPKKNLIAGRLFGHEKRDLIILLSSLIDEGAFVIYRIPKLAACITYASMQPNLFAQYGIWRHCVEIQYLSLHRNFLLNIEKDEDFSISVYSNPFAASAARLVNNPQVFIDYLMLFNLIIPDCLELHPNVNIDQAFHLFHKRLYCAHKCCFL